MEKLILTSKNVYDIENILDFAGDQIEAFIISLKDCIYLVKKDLAIKLLTIERNKLFKLNDYIIPFYCFSNEISVAGLRKPEYLGLLETFSLEDRIYNSLQSKFDCSFFWENLKNDKIFYLDEPIIDNDKNPFEEEEG